MHTNTLWEDTGAKRTVMPRGETLAGVPDRETGAFKTGKTAHIQVVQMDNLFLMRNMDILT